MAGPDAPSAPFTGETDAALPDTSHVPAATDGPVVAPLPRSEISLGEALASLSPGMIDLDKRCLVVVNGRRINAPSQFIEPDLETLLADVRTRGDRQHPFWVKLESSTGRVHRGR